MIMILGMGGTDGKAGYKMYTMPQCAKSLKEAEEKILVLMYNCSNVY